MCVPSRISAIARATWKPALPMAAASSRSSMSPSSDVRPSGMAMPSIAPVATGDQQRGQRSRRPRRPAGGGCRRARRSREAPDVAAVGLLGQRRVDHVAAGIRRGRQGGIDRRLGRASRDRRHASAVRATPWRAAAPVAVLDGHEGRALPAPPVPVERDLAEPEAARVGDRPSGARTAARARGRAAASQLEAFGVGEHAKHAGQRILAGTRHGMRRRSDGTAATSRKPFSACAARTSSISRVCCQRWRRLASRVASAAAMRAGERRRELAQRRRREPGQQGRGVERRTSSSAVISARIWSARTRQRRGRRCLGAAAAG